MQITMPIFLQGVTTLVAVIAFMVSIGTARRRDVENRLKSLEADGAEADKRIVALEASIKALPSIQDVHELNINITKVQGDLKAAAEAIRAQQETMKNMMQVLERQEQYLMGKS